jgi:DNA-directed RNA polymerase subunit omega
MARVTVEDCILKIPNRFELVMMAAERARQVAAGAPLSVDRDNDKNPVVALREIADETIDLDGLRDTLVHGLQRHVEADEPEDEEIDLLAAAQELAGIGRELGVDAVTASDAEDEDLSIQEEPDSEDIEDADVGPDEDDLLGGPERD